MGTNGDIKALKLEAHLLIEQIAQHPYALSVMRKAIAGLKMYNDYKSNRVYPNRAIPTTGRNKHPGR